MLYRNRLRVFFLFVDLMRFLSALRFFRLKAFS